VSMITCEQLHNDGWNSDYHFTSFTLPGVSSGEVHLDRNPNSNDPRISWCLTINCPKGQRWHMQGFVESMETVYKMLDAAGHSIARNERV
jgi:hypothetical protein